MFGIRTNRHNSSSPHSENDDDISPLLDEVSSFTQQHRHQHQFTQNTSGDSESDDDDNNDEEIEVENSDDARCNIVTTRGAYTRFLVGAPVGWHWLYLEIDYMVPFQVFLTITIILCTWLLFRFGDSDESDVVISFLSFACFVTIILVIIAAFNIPTWVDHLETQQLQLQGEPISRCLAIQRGDLPYPSKTTWAATLPSQKPFECKAHWTCRVISPGARWVDITQPPVDGVAASRYRALHIMSQNADSHSLADD